MKPLDDYFTLQDAARSDAEAKVATESTFLLLFTLERTVFATPVDRVREIVDHPPLTPLPIADDTFVGVINLRGNLIPILSAARIAGGRLRPTTSGRFVIFETAEKEPFAIEVESVHKVVFDNVEVTRSSRFEEVIRINGGPVHLLNFQGEEGARLLRSRARPS
jgi:chemotaxis signal transduction protein